MKLMAFFSRYWATLAVLAAGLAAAWWLTSLVKERDALRQANQILTVSVASLREQVDQTQEALAVARVVSQQERARAIEYDALREALIGGNNDADLPEWFVDYLHDLGVGGVSGADTSD